MPPIRRYVRISPHSCLEVRIFIDNPADINTWLLRPSNPALPRVFNAVKPLILPKLREENERTRQAKGKSGKKKKGVKDVIKGDDFEVVVFLTEGQGRHEVVIKRKEAKDIGFGQQNQTGRHKDTPVVIREKDEDSDDDIAMSGIPAANSQDVDAEDSSTGMTRRKVTEGDDDGDFDGQEYDEKKKLGFKTRYDGFSIWGKVLCLLVERKGGPSSKHASSSIRTDATGATLLTTSGDDGAGAQQALMQEWISSTQIPQDDDEDG